MGLNPSTLPWLDSRTDIRYPEHISTRKLTHLAAEHQFLNPFAHRAVFDVLTMLTVASRYPIGDIIQRAQEPNVTVRAVVSFDERDKAKARGYQWQPAEKIWRRVWKESEYLADRDVCGFRTIVLNAGLVGKW